MNSTMITSYFTTGRYELLIKSCPITLRVMDYSNHSKGVILRHDVDFSLDLAFEFSRVEKRNSVFSTYYILLTSDLYNPLSRASQEIINTMLAEGFEIGLHFDPTAYGDISEEDLEIKFHDEIRILESTFDFKVKSYSLHNPSIHGKYPNFEGIINAYNPEIFSDDRYISDSMFSFRDKDPMDYIEKSKNQLIQFLTHPIHYFIKEEISYSNGINLIMNNYYKKIDSILQVNKVYLNERDKISKIAKLNQK